MKDVQFKELSQGRHFTWTLAGMTSAVASHIRLKAVSGIWAEVGRPSDKGGKILKKEKNLKTYANSCILEHSGRKSGQKGF